MVAAGTRAGRGRDAKPVGPRLTAAPLAGYAARLVALAAREESDVATTDGITLCEQVSLSADELAEVLALKRVCDACEGLDLKLGFGAAAPELTTYPAALLARAGGELVGYCSLDGDDTDAEMCGMIHPDWRRQRLAMRLYEAAQAGFRRAGGRQLFMICEDGSASGHGFLRTLAPQRSFAEHRMVWRGASSAAPTAAQTQPDALTVERARPADYQALASALSRAFDHTEARLLDDLTSASAVATEQVYLARLAGVVIGGFRLSAMADATGIYAFGIDRGYQRQGWGRRMLAWACALATEQGAPRVTLEVDTDNAPASALYRASGFETITTYGYYLCAPSA